jgi:hypothetical protein
MYLQKLISKNSEEKKILFASVLKVTDEKNRIRSRIRIRILSSVTLKTLGGTDPEPCKNSSLR